MCDPGLTEKYVVLSIRLSITKIMSTLGHTFGDIPLLLTSLEQSSGG